MALTKKSGMGEQLNIQLLSGQERETSNFGFFFLKKKFIVTRKENDGVIMYKYQSKGKLQLMRSKRDERK
jgi:hypothetical protein